MAAAPKSGYVAARSLKAGGRPYMAGEPIEPDDVFNWGILVSTGSVEHSATPKGQRLVASYEKKQDFENSRPQPEFASDEAQELAARYGLTTADIKGSGSGGNIKKSDVQDHIEANELEPIEDESGSGQTPENGSGETPPAETPPEENAGANPDVNELDGPDGATDPDAQDTPDENTPDGTE